MTILDQYKKHALETAKILGEMVPPPEHREVVRGEGWVQIFDKRTGAFVMQMSDVSFDTLTKESP